ncbi:MAG: hypothetical protein J1F61_06295 [Clostridiales bacterium]|nr:hypothetical protein [Clostridiales bacterium]
MNDFKSFSNEKNNGSTTQNSGDAQLNNTVEMAKLITKAMNGKSTMQIMQTIISEAERGKREGTLTNADLDNFYNALSPLLDGAKKRRLKQVIEKLKEI